MDIEEDSSCSYDYLEIYDVCALEDVLVET